MREYLRQPVRSDWHGEHRATDSLARTVHEDYELIDTGVVDAAGNKIMARNRMDQIGFVRSKV